MTHLSSFTLNSLLIGALSQEELSSAKGHLENCERCRGDLEELQASHATFTRQVLPRTLPLLLEREAKRLAWWRLSPPILIPSLATIALVVFLVPTVLRRTNPSTPLPELSIKGGPALRIYARRQQRVFAVNNKSALAPGDEVQFVVQPGGLPYVLIASVDGSGAATIYVPFGGAQSLLIDPNLKGQLPGSVTLDSAPGPERIFALFSKRPLSAAEVTDALQKIGAQGASAIRSQRTLPVAADAQISLVFEKTAR